VRSSRPPSSKTSSGTSSEPTLPPGLELKYAADLRLLPPGVPFVELRFDAGAAEYVRGAVRARPGRFLTWLHGLLTHFWSDFEVNGWLDLYPMFVLSTAQWAFLLESTTAAALELERPRGRLLDVGAGRGDVTRELSRLFETTTVTETSSPMAKRLRRQGFEVVEGDLADQGALPQRFDAVSLLNVLDRCDRPLSLLSSARLQLGHGGLLIVALVLPYEPIVLERGQRRAPEERLPITASTFEAAASELVEFVLRPLGLRVEVLSRAPYLSGGDADAPLYELDDLIVVCRAEGEVTLLSGRS
jgi:SAM-dependent methyltransferase